MKMVLQKLFINSFFPVFLFSYNFQFEANVNAYSNKLYFDIFDNKWKQIPSKSYMNRVLDYSNINLSYKNNNNSYGIGYLNEGTLKVNKGFIETWYYAANDFNILLKKSDIGYYISEPKIYGKMNYSQFRSIFLQKFYQNFKIKYSILQGKVLQYMKIKGINTKKHFIADLYYNYSDRNLLMQDYLKSNDYRGLGYSIDISYSKKYPSFEYNINFYNILGAIYWKNIVFMKYHFDSNTKYKDENGYYHYRPFGVGKLIKTNFYQKLPFYISYKLKKTFKKFFIEDEGMYNDNNRYDSLFLGKKYFKIGYVPQIKNVVFGFENKNINIELSNNIKYHSKFLKIYLKFRY